MYIFRKVTILFMRSPNEILNNIDRRAVSLRLRRTRTYCLSVYTLFAVSYTHLTLPTILRV